MNDNYNHENNNNNKNNNNLFPCRKKVIFGFFLSFLSRLNAVPRKKNSGLSRVPPKKIGHGNVGTEISVENWSLVAIYILKESLCEVLYKWLHCWTHRVEIWHWGPHLPKGGCRIQFVWAPPLTGSRVLKTGSLSLYSPNSAQVGNW